MDRDPFDLIGDVLDGQFRVEAFAGEGDLSVVYKGHHVGVDAPVAIKCLNLPDTLDPALAGPLVHGFTEASRIHYRLARGNLHIAQTIASGSTLVPRTGVVVPYLVREWFDGESLASDLANRRTPGANGSSAGGRPLDEALALLETAFDGVAYAHAQGDVHLSVNPSNLFVVARESAPQVLSPAYGSGRAPASASARTLKVLDFGVARTMNGIAPGLAQGPGARPGAGLRLLFPAYAAPEQLDRTVGQLGPWTDVYALALVTMEVLSGRIVMGELDTGALVERALDEKHRPTPRAHGLTLPAHIDRSLSRAVSRAPDQRQKNAAELWRDLQGASRSLSPASRPSMAPLSPMASMTGLSAVRTPAPAPVAAAVAAAATSAPAMPRERMPTLVGLSPAGIGAVKPGVATIRPGIARATAGAVAIPVHSPGRTQTQTLAPGLGVSGPWPIIPAPALSGARLSPTPASPEPLGSPFISSFPAPSPLATPPPAPAVSIPPPVPSRAPSFAPPSLAPPPAAGSLPPDPYAVAPPGRVSYLPGPHASLRPTPPPLMPAGKATSLILVGAGSLGWLSILALAMFPMLSWCRAREPRDRPRAAASAVESAESVVASSEPPAPGPRPPSAASGILAPQPAPPPAPAPPGGTRAPASSPALASPAAPPSASPPAPAPASTVPFSLRAAKAALDQTARDVIKCKRGNMSGTAFATVTFGPDGHVSHVSVGTPFTGSASAGCVAETLATAQMAPFAERPGKAAVIVYRFYVAPR